MQNLFVINSAMSRSLGRTMATALIVILWDISLGVACLLGAFRASLPTGDDWYFISGFASASLLWFIALVVAVHMLGSRINSTVLTRLNQICGAIIILYGIRLLCGLGLL